MHKLENNKTEFENLSKISNQSFDEERALYASKNLFLDNVKFIGKKDGESALKESQDIVLSNCLFALRYPLWHIKDVSITNSKFEETCRAPFWYDDGLDINESTLLSPKAFRECKNINLTDTKVDGDEPFWKCKDINLNKCVIGGKVLANYAFFGSKSVTLKNVKFTGKYSFQYINNLYLEDCELDTKDAFWHSKHVYCKNCTIKGEYLAWYSNDITFDHCLIESHQPLCYANKIKLIDCKMPNSDLAFEYSSANGNIIGKIDSIKNLRKGKLIVGSLGELINDEPKYKCSGKVVVKK